MKLGKFGFDISEVLVPDILHEIEIGEAKTLLSHLIRILYSISPQAIAEMNRRY